MSTVAPSALYGIYKQIKPHLSSMKIGGVVGDANHGSGYHISRSDLKAKGKSGDYSIQAPADKRGTANAASAIDITLNQAEMKQVTSRLKAACVGKDYDPRIECMREFIGTLDGRNAGGYNRYKTGRAVGWYASGYSDSSHLWHVHISIFRAYNNDKNMMTGLAEVIAGLKAGELGWKADAASAPDTAPPVVKPPVVVVPPVVKPPVVKPPVVKIPTYYVDPEKVSSQLWALHETREDKLVDPRSAINTGKSVVTVDGKKWLLTDAGYRYALDYLTTVKPAPAVEPEPVPVPTEGPTVRFAFWNTRRSSNAPDHGTDRDWAKRDGLARDFLKGLPGGLPNILATCETTKEQTVDIARFTGLSGIGNGLGGHPKDVSNDNNSVFLDSGVTKLQVVNVNTGTSSEPNAKRYMLCVQVRVNETGNTFWFGATHLNRGTTPAARKVETTVLLKAAQRAGVDLSRFILGLDANDSAPANAPGVRATARDDFGMSDIRDLLGDARFRGDSWDTFTGWTSEVEKTGRHIDIILVGSKVKVSHGEVVPVKNGASDHQLLLAKVTA